MTTTTNPFGHWCRRSKRRLAVSALVALCTWGCATTPEVATGGGGVEIRGRELFVDGEPFRVKGIHYGPWRPGTGPNAGYHYPGRDAVAEDLAIIADAGANTIVVYDPPSYVLDAAEEQGLMVLYTFAVDWWSIGTPDYAPTRTAILDRVKAGRKSPALLGWVVGNEIASHIVEQRGEEELVSAMADVYHAIKAIDADHPVTHSNWPPTRGLAIDFFDIAGFNLYPLWPPEVVARGFGNYIEDILQPIAGDRPLLITEFGVNTIEAGEDRQAELLADGWTAIQASGTVGGVVFEFADEWWKNYDGPLQPELGDWWARGPVPGDEESHDLDPEEHYGILYADRTPKPAFHVVQKLFRESEVGSEPSRMFPAALFVVIAVLAGATWMVARRKYANKT